MEQAARDGLALGTPIFDRNRLVDTAFMLH